MPTAREAPAPEPEVEEEKPKKRVKVDGAKLAGLTCKLFLAKSLTKCSCKLPHGMVSDEQIVELLINRASRNPSKHLSIKKSGYLQDARRNGDHVLPFVVPAHLGTIIHMRSTRGAYELDHK